MNQSGNINATVGVFFDSFAKITISITVLIGAIKLFPGIVYQKIIPGVCFSLFMLNLAYYLQARILSRKQNRLVTALPSGLQSSCVFVWLFAIMLPIASTTHNPLLAYQVALLANLINGIFFTFIGLLLIHLKKYIPTPALFSGLAGSAFTWLTINNLPILFEHPLSGLLPFLIILSISFAKIKTRVPTIMLGIVIGSAIAWCTGEYSFNSSNPINNIGLYLPKITLININPEVIKICIQYLPLILAFAIIDAISAIQTLEESRLGNENFNPQHSIIISGVISTLSVFIGNPFAMALFFGHFSWKQQGADHRYSLYNSLIYLILGLSGIAGLLISIVPGWVTLPVLILIGITTTAISFNALKKEEYMLLVIGIVPILTELLYTKLELLATQNHLENINSIPGINGLFILAKGSILFSLLITTLLYYISKQRWLSATWICLLLSFFTIIGFIHSQTPQINFFTQLNYTYLTCSSFCLIIFLINKFKQKNEI